MRGNICKALSCIISFFAVSGFLLKLMAATGLLIGWKLNLAALMIGYMKGSDIYQIIMAIKKGDRVLAFRPYLFMGVILAMIWGEQR